MAVKVRAVSRKKKLNFLLKSQEKKKGFTIKIPEEIKITELGARACGLRPLLSLKTLSRWRVLNLRSIAKFFTC